MTAIELENFRQWFNRTIDGSRIPKVKVINPARAQMIAYIREHYSNEDIVTAVRNAAKSPFLNGQGRRHQFLATFDWLFQPKNFLKVLENNYR